MAAGTKFIFNRYVVLGTAVGVGLIIATAAIRGANAPRHCIFDERFNRTECCARTIRATDGRTVCAVGQMVDVYNQ